MLLLVDARFDGGVFFGLDAGYFARAAERDGSCGVYDCSELGGDGGYLFGYGSFFIFGFWGVVGGA